MDESLLVKNPFAKRTQIVTEIARECPYRLLLNGTPVSRNEADLYAQWVILDWRILGYRSYHSFAANHLEMDPDYPGKIVRVLETDYLTRKIAPYTYECSKEDVLNLPDKHYITRMFDLTEDQQMHYEYVSDILLEQINEFRPDTIYRLFSSLQEVISGFYVKFSKNKHHCFIQHQP
ncbi:MAG: hypothetical protein LIO99_01755 [Clostridiales bacterium]|nr:hypothetical protein [Clostridiales bacterium]